jgi:hypothetical protein
MLQELGLPCAVWRKLVSIVILFPAALAGVGRPVPAKDQAEESLEPHDHFCPTAMAPGDNHRRSSMGRPQDMYGHIDSKGSNNQRDLKD